MTAHHPRLLLVLALAAWAGCSEGPAPGALTVSMATMALTMPTADPGTPVLDENGLAHLDRFPYILRVALTGPALAEPVTGLWPEFVPEEVPEEVELELSAPPGQDNGLAVVLLVAEAEGQLATYVAPAPDEEPLRPLIEAGEETVLDLTLTELPQGTVQLQWAESLGVVTLAWIDLKAAVVLPPAEPTTTQQTTRLAVGRSYCPVVTLAGGRQLPFTDLVVRLTAEGQFEQVNLPLEE